MAECRKHPGVWALWQLKDNGTYGNYCPACQEWCDDCPSKLETTAKVPDDAPVVKHST